MFLLNGERFRLIPSATPMLGNEIKTKFSKPCSMFPISDTQNESNAIIASKAEPAVFILQTSIQALTTFKVFVAVSFFYFVFWNLKLLCFIMLLPTGSVGITC